MLPLDARIAAAAEPWHGVIDRPCLGELGVSNKALQVRLERGSLVRMHRGVFAIAGVPLGAMAKMTAAWMATARRGVICGPAAAQIWGLDGFEDETPILLMEPGCVVTKPGIETYRSPMGEHDVRTMSRLPVTRVERTMAELAAMVPIGRVEEAIECALLKRLTTYERLSERAIEMRARGRSGSGRLVDLLATRDPNQAPTQSLLETKFHQLLKNASVEGYVAQHELFDLDGFVARPDFYFPKERVVVECLGVRWHNGRKKIVRDARRHNRIEALGCRVLYFTQEDANRAPRRTLNQITAVLKQAARPFASSFDL